MAHIFSLLHVHCKKQFRYLPMSSFLSRLRRHKLLLAFLPALIFLFCSVFYYEINHSFVAFCDTVFRNEITENTLNLHYTLENPEILNLSDPDVSFGSMNPEVLADAFSQQNIYLEKLFKFPKDWLSTKNRLTYDILTSAFSLQAEGENTCFTMSRSVRLSAHRHSCRSCLQNTVFIIKKILKRIWLFFPGFRNTMTAFCSLNVPNQLPDFSWMLLSLRA